MLRGRGGSGRGRKPGRGRDGRGRSRSRSNADDSEFESTPGTPRSPARDANAEPDTVRGQMPISPFKRVQEEHAARSRGANAANWTATLDPRSFTNPQGQSVKHTPLRTARQAVPLQPSRATSTWQPALPSLERQDFRRPPPAAYGGPSAPMSLERTDSNAGGGFGRALQPSQAAPQLGETIPFAGVMAQGLGQRARGMGGFTPVGGTAMESDTEAAAAHHRDARPTVNRRGGAFQSDAGPSLQARMESQAGAAQGQLALATVPERRVASRPRNGPPTEPRRERPSAAAAQNQTRQTAGSGRRDASRSNAGSPSRPGTDPAPKPWTVRRGSQPVEALPARDLYREWLIKEMALAQELLKQCREEMMVQFPTQSPKAVIEMANAQRPPKQHTKSQIMRRLCYQHLELSERFSKHYQQFQRPCFGLSDRMYPVASRNYNETVQTIWSITTSVPNLRIMRLRGEVTRLEERPATELSPQELEHMAQCYVLFHDLSLDAGIMSPTALLGAGPLGAQGAPVPRQAGVSSKAQVRRPSSTPRKPAAAAAATAAAERGLNRSSPRGRKRIEPAAASPAWDKAIERRPRTRQCVSLTELQTELPAIAPAARLPAPATPRSHPAGDGRQPNLGKRSDSVPVDPASLPAPAAGAAGNNPPDPAVTALRTSSIVPRQDSTTSSSRRKSNVKTPAKAPSN